MAGSGTLSEVAIASKLSAVTRQRDHLLKELEEHRQALRELECENAMLRTKVRALGGKP